MASPNPGSFRRIRKASTGKRKTIAATRPSTTRKVTAAIKPIKLTSVIRRKTVSTIKPTKVVPAKPGPRFINRPWSVRFLRPEDFLSVEFRFVNIRRVTFKGHQRLQPYDTKKQSLIIVNFQPQSFAERAYLEDSGPGEPLDPPPVEARISGGSRLVFSLPKSVPFIPYTAADLLETLQSLPLKVSPLAALPKKPLLRPGFVAPGVFQLANPAVKKQIATLAKSLRKRATTATVAAKTKSLSQQISSSLADARRRVVEAANGLDLSVPSVDLGKIPELHIIPPKLRRAQAEETAIEAPWRLLLSPNVLAAWVHAVAPVTSPATGRTELWHTRLGTRIDGVVTEQNVFEKTVRAIDSPDALMPSYKPLPGNDTFPFRMSITPIERHNIVHLTANNYITNPSKKKLPPVPVNVSRLTLSTLGSGLDTEGNWNPEGFGPLDLVSWKHISRLARDHYVKIVLLGYLYPFNHRAVLIKITERKFHPNVSGNTAYLRKREFLVVLEKTKQQGKTGLKRTNQEQFDLQMPFKQSEILTDTTPLLDDKANSNIYGVPGQMFWPRVLNKDFLFDMRLTDLAGNVVETRAPLLFVSNKNFNGSALMPGARDAIVAAYQAQANATDIARRTYPFEGQSIQYAKSEKGDTTFETASVRFTTDKKGSGVYPMLESMSLSVPATKYLLGKENGTDFKFPQPYLIHDIDGASNRGEVFLEVLAPNASTSIDFSQSGEKSGGLIQPSFAINAISRLRGPVGGTIADAASAKFDPTSFFGNLPASALPKLFGCIPLTELIDGIQNLLTGGNLAKAPSLITDQLNAAQALLDAFEKLLQDLAAVGQAADNLVSALQDAIVAVGDFFSDPTDPAKQTALQTALSNLHAQAGLFRTALANLPQINPTLQQRIDQALASLIDDLANVNDFVSKLISVIEMITERKIRLEWTPQVSPWPSNVNVPLYEPKTATPLVLAVELQAASATKKEASFSISCTLEPFVLNLLLDAQFMRLHFNRIQFISVSGKKPDVTVDFDEIEFVGVLSFIESLKSLIPLDGFSDPPNLVIDENGIEASFSISLPNIAVGVFSLSNMSLGAAFTVPFIGDPISVRFNFCERHNPFNLTVWVFGGGGFFGVTVTPAGVQILEAAFEFGACASLDFGVASGSVKVVAGVYFRMEGDEASLTGYFRLNGKVDVLGLISASLELYLELEYEFASGKCVGRASLTIEVEVLFFSASVTVSCEKKFAGSNGDPTFLEMYTPFIDPALEAEVDPWADYCAAYAS